MKFFLAILAILQAYFLCSVEAEDAVTIYVGHNFTGTSQTFDLGYHNMETLNIENDAVKSVRVKSGYHVKLYKHAYFTGRLATVGPGDYPLPSLCSKGFESDELSSLIVEREDGVLKNDGKICLEKCNDRQGPCNYCGTGLCCRKGYHDHSNGCDGSIGGNGRHVCVSHGGMKNDDKLCLGPCNSKVGPCDYCGTGLCCNIDHQGNGCDGSIGGFAHYHCTSKECNKTHSGGCSNHEDILIDTIDDVVDISQCIDNCKLNVECKGFGFEKRSDDARFIRCHLYKSDGQGNECINAGSLEWDYYSLKGCEKAPPAMLSGRIGLSKYVRNRQDTVCEEGWEEFENSCYKHFPEVHDWTAAKDDCVEKGAHLVSIHSIEELHFVRNLHYSSTKPIKTWIGGKRVGGDFQWTDGSNFDFEHWDDNEPNSVNENESCIVLLRDINSCRNEKWSDINCNEENHYICKRKIKDPQRSTVTLPLLNHSTGIQPSPVVDHTSKIPTVLGVSDPSSSPTNFKTTTLKRTTLENYDYVTEAGGAGNIIADPEATTATAARIITPDQAVFVLVLLFASIA